MRKLPVLLFAAATVFTVAGVPMTAQAATCSTSASSCYGSSCYSSSCYGQSCDISSILNQLGCGNSSCLTSGVNGATTSNAKSSSCPTSKIVTFNSSQCGITYGCGR